MTKNTVFEKRLGIDHSPGSLCLSFLGVFCLLLFLRNSEIAFEYMSHGLQLCAKTIVPSLFPFMVLSEMIVSGGVVSSWIKRISKPMQRLFRISEVGCCAVILGLLCGFPVGARCTVVAHRQGKMDREEASRVLAFSNSPSPAFLISAVGSGLWENPRLGMAFYLTSLLSTVITGIFLARFQKKAEITPFPYLPDPVDAHRSPIHIFCDAIRSSAGSILTVCAYIVFFSAFVGTLNHLPFVAMLPQAGKAFFFCLFELSSGVGQAASIMPTIQGICLSAFAIGWSGLSVHCQILSVCDGTDIPMRHYFFSKLLQAALCPVLLLLFLTLFPGILSS